MILFEKNNSTYHYDQYHYELLASLAAAGPR